MNAPSEDADVDRKPDEREALARAAAWLQPCDPASDDIQMDSAFRFTRAFIDPAKDASTRGARRARSRSDRRK